MTRSIGSESVLTMSTNNSYPNARVLGEEIHLAEQLLAGGEGIPHEEVEREMSCLQMNR